MNNIGTTSFAGNKKTIIATVIFAILVIGLVVYGLSIK